MSKTVAQLVDKNSKLVEAMKVVRDVTVALAPTVTVIVAAKVISDQLKKD